MTSGGLRWMVLCCVACCWESAPCFVPQLYRIGIAHIGRHFMYPSWTRATMWCDEVMLCGRSPLSLRIITVKTTADALLQIIEREPQIDLWLLTVSHDVNTTEVLDPLLQHYQTPATRRFLDFSHRNLPDTDSAWCSLALKSADMSGEERQTQPPSPLDVQVGYVLSTMKQVMLNKVVVVFDENTELEAARLSEGLSSMQCLHTLRHRHSSAGQGEGEEEEVEEEEGGSSLFSIITQGSHWGQTLLDFDDFTNVVLWCGRPCALRFLKQMIQNADDQTKATVLHHMTRILIVDSSIQTNASFAGLDSQSETSKQLHVPSTMADEGRGMLGMLADIQSIVREFYHVAVLWKDTDCVRLQTLMLTEDGGRHFSYAGFGDNLGAMAMTSEVFPNAKWRLNGQKFFVGTTVWPPFVIEDQVNGTQGYGGLCMDILTALASSLNFTYELLVPHDGEFGSTVNGNWTGLIKMLKDKEVQMVVAPIAVDDLRSLVADFSTPFYQDYSGVLFRRPDPAEHKWKTFFRPFRTEVLICIGISLVVAATVGHVVGVVSVKVLHGDHSASDMRVMDTVQYFFGSLLSQGGVWNPNTGSARMFVSAWWVFCVVMAAIYSGNLTASLAVSWNDPPFSTLQQMLDEGSYHFGTVPGTLWADIFQQSNRSDFQAIHQEMERLTQKYSAEEIDEISDHVAMAKKGRYAYIGNMASLTVTVQHNCDLMTLDETFLPMHYSIALQKGSPLTPVVSRWILKMTESGLDEFWSSRWWNNRSVSCHTPGTTTGSNNLTLEDVQTAFFILLLGLALALLAILLECLLHIYRRRRGRRRGWAGSDVGVTCVSAPRLSNGVGVVTSARALAAAAPKVPSGAHVVSSVTWMDTEGGAPPPEGSYVNGIHRTLSEAGPDEDVDTDMSLSVRL